MCITALRHSRVLKVCCLNYCSTHFSVAAFCCCSCCCCCCYYYCCGCSCCQLVSAADFGFELCARHAQQTAGTHRSSSLFRSCSHSLTLSLCLPLSLSLTLTLPLPRFSHSSFLSHSHSDCDASQSVSRPQIQLDDAFFERARQHQKVRCHFKSKTNMAANCVA